MSAASRRSYCGDRCASQQLSRTFTFCKGKRASLGIYDTLNTLDVARVGMQLSNLGLNTWTIIVALKTQAFTCMGLLMCQKW